MVLQNTLDQLIQIRAGGRVERCHTIPHTTSYNNASHSWGVAMIMLKLWPEDFPKLAVHCLVHDVPEGCLGDIPSPTFKFCPKLSGVIEKLEDRIFKALSLPNGKELTELEYKKLKNCDHLELYFWCLEQQWAGNFFVKECVKRLEDLFKQDDYLLPEAYSLFLNMQFSGTKPLMGFTESVLQGD